MLEKEYGNKIYCIKLLINDIRELNIVKIFKSFEKLAHEANTFAARLRLMGKEGDVENTYILQEIEGKALYFILYVGNII